MFVPASNTELHALTKKCQLSRDAYILVEKFLDLNPEIQQTFVDYQLRLFTHLLLMIFLWFLLQVHALEVAAYRRELKLQAKD